MSAEPSTDWLNWLPAWVQAIGSVFAVLIAVWVGNREHKRNLELWKASKNEKDADRRLQARSLAMAIYLPLLEVKAKVDGSIGFVRETLPLRIASKNFNETRRAKVVLPAVLPSNVERLYLLGEAGHEVQQVIALINQLNSMIDTIEDSLNRSHHTERVSLQPINQHLHATISQIDAAIASVRPIHDGDTISQE